MPGGAYLRFLIKVCPCCDFTKDSLWSWVMAFMAFLQHINNVGLVHGLGVFFHLWSRKLGVSAVTLIWIQTVHYAFNFLAGPFVVGLTKRFPAPIVGAAAGVVNCAAFLIAAYAGNSVWILIAFAGAMAGAGSAFFLVYPMNLMNFAFEKYRPFALGVVNLGAPVGAFIYPHLAHALIGRTNMETALMVLGLLWLVNGVLMFFMVEYDDENKDEEEDKRKIEGHITTDDNDLKHTMKNTEENAPLLPDEVSSSMTSGAVSCRTPTPLPPQQQPSTTLLVKGSLFPPIMSDSKFLWMMLYGFFHYGAMICLVGFLPPLLNESLLPINNALEGPKRVAVALAAFGAGGIFGDLGLAIIMNFGPLANRHFAIFFCNDLIMILVSVLLIKVQSFQLLCLLSALLGFSFESWFSVVWTLMFGLFSAADAMVASGILTFCWGSAAIFFPIFESFILSSQQRSSSSTDDFLFYAGQSNETTTPLPTYSSTSVEQFGPMQSRTEGHVLVLYMLAAFHSIASLSQIGMYFHVIRRSRVGEKEQVKD